MKIWGDSPDGKARRKSNVIQRVVGEGYRDVMPTQVRVGVSNHQVCAKERTRRDQRGEYGAHLYSFLSEDPLRDFDVFFIDEELESFTDLVGGAGLMGRSGLAPALVEEGFGKAWGGGYGCTPI